MKGRGREREGKGRAKGEDQKDDYVNMSPFSSSLPFLSLVSFYGKTLPLASSSSSHAGRDFPNFPISLFL